MKILVPIDGSKFTDMCLKTTAWFCKGRDVEIHLLNVTHHISDFDFELVPRDREVLRDSLTKRSEDLLGKAAEFLKSQGLTNITTVILKGASASNEIVEYAEKEKMNLIIIGARGMSEQARFHLGAETPKVVKYAPCCVYVVKESCLEFCAV
jgi:nucleotide-binding universal stress UspA family protein